MQLHVAYKSRLPAERLMELDAIRARVYAESFLMPPLMMRNAYPQA